MVRHGRQAHSALRDRTSQNRTRPERDILSTWIKLHDNFFRNPKVLAAGDDAALLYVQGLCYCSDSETDGRIPTTALRHISGHRSAQSLARILVREGLWKETATGWEVHDYLKVQRSKAQIEGEREANRTRASRYRTSRTSNGVTNGVSHGQVTPPDTDTETDNPSPTPPPAPVTALPPEKIQSNVSAIRNLKQYLHPTLNGSNSTKPAVQLNPKGATNGDHSA